MPGSLPELWRDGGTALGAWLFLRDPLLAEAAATAGYDYVCIDLQHGLQDLDHMSVLLHAMARTPAVPVVRVPWNEPGLIGRALDAGALGIIVPMVNSAEEARRAVSACRYAPAGTRSYGPLAVATRYGPDYLATANDVVACIPMIETEAAVDAIDDILGVPGIDAVYIGPSDLSLTYGLRPAPDHPGDPFQGALTRVVDACQRHGVVPGVHANPALAAARHQAGFRMITVGYDAVPAIAALRNDARTSRADIGG